MATQTYEGWGILVLEAPGPLYPSLTLQPSTSLNPRST